MKRPICATKAMMSLGAMLFNKFWKIKKNEIHTGQLSIYYYSKLSLHILTDTQMYKHPHKLFHYSHIHCLYGPISVIQHRSVFMTRYYAKHSAQE